MEIDASHARLQRDGVAAARSREGGVSRVRVAAVAAEDEKRLGSE